MVLQLLVDLFKIFFFLAVNVGDPDRGLTYLTWVVAIESPSFSNKNKALVGTYPVNNHSVTPNKLV